jgi:hypothetical protein
MQTAQRIIERLIVDFGSVKADWFRAVVWIGRGVDMASLLQPSGPRPSALAI